MKGELFRSIGYRRLFPQQLSDQVAQLFGWHADGFDRAAGRPLEADNEMKIQKIPRPPDFQLGPAAHWRGCQPLSPTKEAIQAALKPLGQEQWSEIRAAVLCALFEEDGCLCVLLTRRAASLRSHTSEVSFPGGRLEQGETPEQAALREAYEEVGLDPAGVEILGNLSPFSTRKYQVAFLPFVAWLAEPPVLTPNPDEVEQVLRVPLARLREEGVHHQEIWNLPEIAGLVIHFFELDEDIVWGATAHVLDELLGRLFHPNAQAEDLG